MQRVDFSTFVITGESWKLFLFKLEQLEYERSTSKSENIIKNIGHVENSLVLHNVPFESNKLSKKLLKKLRGKGFCVFWNDQSLTTLKFWLDSTRWQDVPSFKYSVLIQRTFCLYCSKFFLTHLNDNKNL